VTCSLDSEFMCLADKKCIVGTLRCDGMPHCHDNSDEMDCDPEGRNKERIRLHDEFPIKIGTGKCGMRW